MATVDNENSLNSSNATPKNPFNGDFAKFAEETIKGWKVPGLSIAVVDDQDIFAEGYGFATLPDKPATPETLWCGGSTAKGFTAASMAHLIDSKKYPSLFKGWATPISSIIHDDFILQDEWMTTHITLEDAVSHRTGMPRHDRACFNELNGAAATPKDLVRNLRNLALTAEPRTKFMYNNWMYIVLSHVIETLTGAGLGDVLKEQIWDPLGMDSTFLDLDQAKAAPEHLATGYYWDEEDNEFKPAADMKMQEMRGTGAIFSNVLDYAKWLKCLLHEGTPFSKETHRDIRTPRMMGAMPMGGKDINMYGLGWQRTLYKGHVMYHNMGGVLAYGSQAYWFPDHRFAVVAFGNTCMSSNGAGEILAYRLIDEKLGISEQDRLPHEAIWRGIIDYIGGSNDKAVSRLYPDQPDPPLPPTLNTSLLTGTYHDPGYGAITLREEPHPTRPDEMILLADRPEMTWRYTLELHHVSGDHWVVYDKIIGIPNSLFNDFSAGEFRIGADGKVSSLDIHWESHVGPPMDEGVTSFRKIS